jgi:hypothetical protein
MGVRVVIAVIIAAALVACAAGVYITTRRAPLLDDQWPKFVPSEVVDARELVPTYLDATVEETAEAAAVVRGWSS